MQHMRQSRKRKATFAIGLAAALVGGLVQMPAAPAAPRRAVAAPFEASDPISYIIPTEHGDLYMEVVHPTRNDKVVKAPVILTMSPYSALGRNEDADRWVPRGYARAWVDVVGTGNSGGCFDYGGNREKETGYETVEWIADQKWSTGKIGMIGSSYNGATATATAVTRPPHLTTIVPEAAVSRWYGYSYSGGIRYSLSNEFIGHEGPGSVTDLGFDKPLLFDFGYALPPPVDPQDEKWAERVRSSVTPCDEIDHTTRGYDLDLPNYDKFWIERDYVKDAAKIKIPVLVAHNWGDWNVKQEEGWNLFHALKNARQRVLYMGSRWHGHGAPGGDYENFVDDWMDRYLMGKKNGIDKAPEIISQTADSDGPGKWLKGTPKTRNVVIYAQDFPFVPPGEYNWKLMPSKPQAFGATEPASFPSANANTESHANHHGPNNHDWRWFEGAMLRKDARVFGQIKVQIYSKADRKWITFVPSILDYDHDCHTTVGNQHVLKPECGTAPLVSTTRGFLDSRYRNGLARPQDVKAGSYFPITVPMKPIDYTFKKGHSIGLQIQTEALEWMVPKPYPGGCDHPDAQGQSCPNIYVDWAGGKTRVIIPVVNGPKDDSDLFCIPGKHKKGCKHEEE